MENTSKEINNNVSIISNDSICNEYGYQKRRESIINTVLHTVEESNSNLDDDSNDDNRQKKSMIRRSFRNSFHELWSSIKKWDDKVSFESIHYKFDIKAFCDEICKSIRISMDIIRASPIIPFSTISLFILLCGIGGSMLIILKNNHIEDKRLIATDYAHLMGTRITRQLDDAVLPLFTLSQFVQNLDIFKDLPHQIGNRGDIGALQPMNGPRSISHRNISGVCDDPILNKTFTNIASSIKKDARLENILISVQLAPSCVICLVHPLYNTEDFDNGIYLDNHDAIGHDLLNDPNRSFIAQATIPAYPDPVTVGPLPLIQKGTPTVKEALIARLAIFMEGYSITLPDGIEYPCWGFAVVLLNWFNLKKASGMETMAKEAGLQFILTRTDKKKDSNGDIYNEIVTIGTSEKHHLLNNDNSLTVSLNTTYDNWKMTVGYEKGFHPEWFNLAIAFVIVISFLFCILFMLILITKKQYQILLYNMMPKHIIAKLQRGKTVVERYDLATIFFSDIVGFTSMSGNMRPVDVMAMLNELYTEFDKLVQKHDIYKVETIGDAYIVIGGGPDCCSARDGAERVGLFALDVMEYVKEYKTSMGTKVYIRAGIASGPVVAGVIGTTMPKFTLFGDTVNFASRMESTGEKMKIQCNEVTYNILKDIPSGLFSFEERYDKDNNFGVYAKGKGRVHTWWIHDAGVIFESNPDKYTIDDENDSHVK